MTSLATHPQDSPTPVWRDDAPPSCPVGMELLRRFEEARPKDYAFLDVQDFTDLNTSAFVGIPEWDAFTEHCGTCKDCKESSAVFAEQ